MPPPPLFIHSLLELLKRIYAFVFTPYKLLDSDVYLLYRKIAIFALLNIFFLIFVFTPFAVYSSDVSQFDPSRSAVTLGGLFGFFLLFSFLSIYITSFFYHTRLLKFGTYGVSVILSIGLVYTFIFNYNIATGESYSEIDNFTFKNPHGIPVPKDYWYDLGICTILCFLVLVIFFRPRWFLCMWQILFITLVVMVVYYMVLISDRISNHLSLPQDQVSGELPSFHAELSSFSKNHPNVLILLSDGFSGSHLEIILEQFSNFKNDFEGFVYYPNTVSVDGHTTRTAHTILTGFKTSPINNRDKNLQTYSQYAHDELLNFYKKLNSSNYIVHSYNMPHIDEQDSDESLRIYADHGVGYTQYYINHMGVNEYIRAIRSQNVPIGEMSSIGLFYFSPYTLRSRLIYKEFTFGNYSWIFGSKTQIGTFINAVKLSSILPSFAQNLGIVPETEDNKPIFKYIHTYHTHYPFALEATECKPQINPSSILSNEYLSYINNPNHYDNEVCAVREFTKILDFLKQNQIYDNTMIILVSDHSYNDLIAHKSLSGYSLGNNPNPLLLIKPFKSRAPFEIDMRLMSNADVYGILCDKLGLACEATNILEHYPKHRSLVHTLNVHWTEESRNANSLLFQKIWRIDDNVLDPKNWHEITQEIK